MDRLQLPSSPAEQTGPVRAWAQPVILPTYQPLPPDKNPMFLERRVYQGSSGKVYPLAFTDRISEESTDQSWQAIHLENSFLRLMILPQLGGRIHVAMDKSNGYDFIYRQRVIKPALVGLAGPWISGGIEFNWPQHHRPSTFMPADVHIQAHPDGSRTVWLGEHEPMNRMKGMHGVRLHPDKAYIELCVRLYNRTPLMQTFLWWANVAVRVHERYQSFFPPDIFFVADHAKRATSDFPLCHGFYYGVDYGTRGRQGVPMDQRPRHFVPPGDYPAHDLSWYANIPVPTSYMCMGTEEDFFGGYDHAAEAGIVHVADHHISPGKKQWTWGNHEFGYAWDRNLTDADGPYIELMAGVYTDNQPDFSFLHPYETRTFSQYWYPIQKIGPAQRANLDAAVSLKVERAQARIGVSVSGNFPGSEVCLEAKGRRIAQWKADLSPGHPLIEQIAVPAGCGPADLKLCVRRQDGSKLIDYQPRPPMQAVVPPPATEPPAPEQIDSDQELYLTGLHLEQYRHATRDPSVYWRHALRRNPQDVACNNALGLWHLRRGEFARAEPLFRQAVGALTARNPNPRDGEPHYNLGLCLRWLGKDEEAYAAFYKATWNYAWQSAAFYALAEMDCRRGDWPAALDHLDRSLRVNADHLKARNLKTIVLRNLHRAAEAEQLLSETLANDPLDFWARFLGDQTMTCDLQTHLDVALDFAAAGLYDRAIALLTRAGHPQSPLVHYHLGYFAQQRGDDPGVHYARAAAAPPDYCFPWRLEEMVILQAAMAARPADAKTPYYLGNLLYDRRRHQEAIVLWERSAQLDASFSIVWRNLGIAYHNVQHDPAKARQAYDKAVAANSDDARLWYERDQLCKRLGENPRHRLAQINQRLDLAARRDDLCVELAALYNQTGQHQLALDLLNGRRFQPWEGGEGQVLGQFVRAHLALGKKSLAAGDAMQAKAHFHAALNPPENLGEARHLLANQSDVHFWLGQALSQAGDAAAAGGQWRIAAAFAGDFQQMSVKSFSEMTFYRALALQRLGQAAEAEQLLQELLAHAKQMAESPARIDYFATSLPALLLFEDDLQRRQTITARFLMAQANLGLGRRQEAQQLLEKVLEMDGNHPLAADLLAEIGASQGQSHHRAGGSV
jgi:tetratricopeptide (TPR) repeat protein